jgi:L-alanine-DL-glutamate epimerase-like enolase superfamily enzyme
MKITNIDAWPVSLKLTVPYTIAYERYHSAVNILFRIDTSTGISGWGCSAPDLHVTGDTPDEVLRLAKGVIQAILQNADPLRPILHLKQLSQTIKHAPAALAMVDMAMYDLIGKIAGVPLYRLLGGFRTKMITSVTIGILPVQETVAKASEYRDRGFVAIKIKGGKDLETDIEKVIKVREAVGREIHLRFDANQGYSEKQAIDFCTRIQTVNLEFLEQPVDKNYPEVMGRVKHNAGVPIMADESLLTLKDAFRLTQMDWVDLINIKLMKVGGITEASLVNAVAAAAGIESMVGCMDETALSIAAGLHFALAQPNVRYLDLDGHLNLMDDPTRGTVKIKDGKLYPLELPGLGFDGIL